MKWLVVLIVAAGCALVEVPAVAQEFELINTTHYSGTTLAIQVAGDYAYFGGPAGLQVVSIADPTDAWQVGGYRANVGDVFVLGNYAYLVVDDITLQIVDISDPLHPQFMG